MCIVIDTNAMASVFVTSSKEHNQFKPVHDWILHKNGTIVYGGTTYFNELVKTKKFVPIFRRLKDKGKVIELHDCEKVDAIEECLKAKVNDKKFNDPHIVAIIIVSKCKIVCTKDGRSFKFVLDKTLYPKGISPPKIYKQESNKNILKNDNIAEICKPNVILNKRELAALQF